MLPESVVIMEYLEERYPEPALWPADAAERALARLLVERFYRLSDPYYSVRRGDESARGDFEARLGELDGLLEERPFLTGREYGHADIPYLPWIIRMDHSAFPAVADWVERCPSGRRSLTSWSSSPGHRARGADAPPGGAPLFDVRPRGSTPARPATRATRSRATSLARATWSCPSSSS